MKFILTLIFISLVIAQESPIAVPKIDAIIESNALESLFGTWHIEPVEVPIFLKGKKFGQLILRPNGHYEWVAKNGDEAKGKWQNESGEFPISIIGVKKQKKWFLKFDKDKEILILSDLDGIILNGNKPKKGSKKH